MARLRFAVLLACLPAVAHAHAFSSGLGPYELFVEGAGLLFHAPELTLAVVALGVLIGLWDENGMPIVWPALLAGAAAGLWLAPYAPFEPRLPLHGSALASALLAALAWRYPTAAMRAYAAVAGGLAAYGAAAGHGAEGLPIPVLCGVVFGVGFFTAAVAGLASLPRRYGDAVWLRIGLRVAASWLAAITIMMAAFALR